MAFNRQKSDRDIIIKSKIEIEKQNHFHIITRGQKKKKKGKAVGKGSTLLYDVICIFRITPHMYISCTACTYIYFL